MVPLLPSRTALNLWLRLTVKRRLARAQDPVEQRRQFDREAEKFPQPSGAVFEKTQLDRPDPPGPLPLLWASRGPSGCGAILYLHGGAYFTGSLKTHRHIAAVLAGRAQAKTLLPDYRLAPENPFPAALDDAFDAYRHLLDNGHAPGRIALAGDSAGGGLAFALLLKLDAEGLPAPAAVVAFSPWTDLTETADSLRRNAWRDPMLPAHRFKDAADFYLDGQPPDDPLASPAFGQFRNPPPALIFASRDEILVDDADAMAKALRAGGGEVTLEVWPQVPHSWPIFAGVLPEAESALDQAGAFLLEHFAQAD